MDSEASLRSRGYLPHLERKDGIYFVTFRIQGPLPNEVRLRMEEDNRLRQGGARPINDVDATFISGVFEEYLDSNQGDCWLSDPSIAQIVFKALKYWDGERYDLHASTVMPNHVHVVTTPRSSLSRVNQSWKSYTANEANRVLKRKGQFWQREYYDRLIRDEKELIHCIEYTLNNPVKAGLCEKREDWPYTHLEGWTP